MTPTSHAEVSLAVLVTSLASQFSLNELRKPQKTAQEDGILSPIKGPGINLYLNENTRSILWYSGLSFYPGISFGHWFTSRCSTFQCSPLLKDWEKQQRMVQVLIPCQHTCETRGVWVLSLEWPSPGYCKVSESCPQHGLLVLDTVKFLSPVPSLA